MTHTNKAYVAIILQSIIIGLSFLVVKTALQSADTLLLLAHRFSIATVACVVFLIIKREKIALKPLDVLKILPFSIIYPVAFFLLQTLGLKYISSSDAGIIYALVPLITFILAMIILKEKSHISQYLFIALSVAGVIFINVMNGLNISGHGYKGVIFISLSTLSFALYNVLGRKLLRSYSVFSIVFVMTIAGCVIFNISAIVQHFNSPNGMGYFAPFTNISFLLSTLYLGVISSLITFLLSTYALSHLTASKVGLFNNVSTVVSILAGTIFLQEKLYYYHYIGIAAVLIGTFLFSLFPLSKHKNIIR